MSDIVMSGSLGAFDVPSILQAVSLSRQYTTIRLWSSGKVKTGEIRIKAGQVLQAQSETLVGRDAFLEILSGRHATFSVERTQEPNTFPQPLGSLHSLLLGDKKASSPEDKASNSASVAADSRRRPGQRSATGASPPPPKSKSASPPPAPSGANTRSRPSVAGSAASAGPAPTRAGTGAPTRAGPGTPSRAGTGAPTRSGTSAPTRSGTSTPTRSGTSAPTRSGSASSTQSAAPATLRSTTGTQVVPQPLDASWAQHLSAHRGLESLAFYRIGQEASAFGWQRTENGPRFLADVNTMAKMVQAMGSPYTGAGTSTRLSVEMDSAVFVVDVDAQGWVFIYRFPADLPLGLMRHVCAMLVPSVARLTQAPQGGGQAVS